MQAKMSLMPCKCASCGFEFNMAYDLGPTLQEVSGLGAKELMTSLLSEDEKRGTAFCWKCR